MTETTAPAAAAQIVRGCYFTPEESSAVVAALAAAGWLHDPRELNERLAAVGAAALAVGRERIGELEVEVAALRAEVAALRAVADAARAIDAVDVLDGRSS